MNLAIPQRARSDTRSNFKQFHRFAILFSLFDIACHTWIKNSSLRENLAIA